MRDFATPALPRLLQNGLTRSATPSKDRRRDPRRTPVGGRRWTGPCRAGSYLRCRAAPTYPKIIRRARQAPAGEAIRPREGATPLPRRRAGTPDAPARGEDTHGETEEGEIGVDAPSPPLRAATARQPWRCPVVPALRLPDPRSGCTSVRRVPAARRRPRRPPGAVPPRAPCA